MSRGRGVVDGVHDAAWLKALASARTAWRAEDRREQRSGGECAGPRGRELPRHVLSKRHAPRVVAGAPAEADSDATQDIQVRPLTATTAPRRRLTRAPLPPVAARRRRLCLACRWHTRSTATSVTWWRRRCTRRRWAGLWPSCCPSRWECPCRRGSRSAPPRPKRCGASHPRRPTGRARTTSQALPCLATRPRDPPQLREAFATDACVFEPKLDGCRAQVGRRPGAASRGLCRVRGCDVASPRAQIHFGASRHATFCRVFSRTGEVRGGARRCRRERPLSARRGAARAPPTPRHHQHPSALPAARAGVP